MDYTSGLIACLVLLGSLSQVSGLCSTCQEELCHNNGECIIGCVPGYVGEYCDEACPPRCLNKACHIHIVSGVIACTDGCIKGYCDIKCTEPCPGDCVTCDRDCGSCNVTLCPERRYGADCDEICRPEYEKCDRETGQCIRCGRGYFGNECSWECTGCFTRKDNIRDTCLSGCEICQTEKTCPVGFYGNSCELRCSTGCENPGGCNRATGECSDGCVSGYHGLTCNYTCNGHCLSGKCNRATGECSDGCVSGYHGLTCNTECDGHCLSGKCNRATGECSDGCVSGYHGLTCNYTCNGHCLSGKCNRATGECSTGCVSGYHGLTCNYTCNGHCLSGKCNRATGECSIGCMSGYHGLTCNYTCNSFCEGGVCNQHDGVCTSGNEGSHTAVAIAVPITVVCLLAGMVTAAVIWRRRRSRRLSRSQTEHAEKGTNSTDVVEPLLKYKKDTDSVQQIPDRSIQANTTIVTGPDPAHDILEKTKIKMKSLTSGMIHISAVDTVVDMLQSGRNWVTITGNAGDGKTTLGYLVLKELCEKTSVYSIEEPEECRLLLSLNTNRLILLDDRFGAFTADQVLINKWKNVINDIHKHFTSHGKQNKMKVIFISRKNVMNEARDYLGHFRDSILDPENVVDLSSLKIKDERLKILDYYLTQSKLKVSSEVKQRVADLDIAHGFPHCSMMYPKLKAKKRDLDIEEFFKTPLKFLDITTAVLYTENCKDLFELMIKNNGEFDVYSVEEDARRASLLKVEREQEGSYITVWKNGVCVFAHPSIYESVLSVICDTDPLFCVKYATLSVIRQKLTLTSDERQKSPTRINVEPVPAVLKALAERFREDILQGDYTVFGLRFCDNEDYCKELVASCVYSGTADPEQNGSKQFINQPGKDGATMLCSAARNRRMAAVQSLVKADADVDIQDMSGRTPLHHLCQLKNSTGASAEGNDNDCKHNSVDLETVRLIINKGRGDVNICDQYRQTPLHYLCQIRNLISPAVKQIDDKLQDVVIEAMRLIITEGRGDLNIGDQCGQTPLHYLCQIMNSATADGHYDDKLQRVVTNAMRMIIANGRGDINISDNFGQSPLHYLFKFSTFTTEEIQWITTKGKGVLNKCEQHKSTPLHYLCANSGLQLDTVDLVIKEGKGDFNKGDEHGTTPLHYLCKNGNLELDVVLQIVNIANGDINKQDLNGITPLHVLCKGSLPIENILALIQQGDKADLYGNTPLHFLCRRRNINAEELQQQLEQVHESTMEKQNIHNNTPLDYLTDKDDSLPWTDGMIARSAVDLVLCRLKLGDNWIVVLGRAMILNSERVHGALQVEDFGRVLTNLEQSRSGDRKSPGQFWRFWGTCSSPVPVPPSPSPNPTPPSYWETSSTLTRRKRGMLLLQMGLIHGRRNMDEEFCVSFLPNSVCVSVMDNCHRHSNRLCIKVLRRDQKDRWGHQVGECVSLSLPTPGVELTLTFGLVLDVGRGRVGFIDVERGQLLCKVDLQMKEEVSPMFYVDPDNDYCATRMRLISGREICVTDRKIHLIQQVLSD